VHFKRYLKNGERKMTSACTKKVSDINLESSSGLGIFTKKLLKITARIRLKI
jgi:hypothetical protein